MAGVRLNLAWPSDAPYPIHFRQRDLVHPPSLSAPRVYARTLEGHSGVACLPLFAPEAARRAE